MALIIGRDFSDVINGEVQAHLSRHDRLVLVSSNTSPLIVQQTNLMTGESSGTVATYSNYYVGDFQGDFEVRHGTVDDAPLLTVSPSQIALAAPAVSCASNLSVACNLSATAAAFSTVATSTVSTSNLTVSGLGTPVGAELFKVSTPVTSVLVAKNDATVLMPYTSAKLGIGTSTIVSGTALTVAGGASVSTTLYTSNVRAAALYYGPSLNDSNYPSITFDQQNKNIYINGDMKLINTSTFTLKDTNFVKINAELANFERISLCNTSNTFYPALNVQHILPTSCNEATEFVETVCNTEPIVDITIAAPLLDAPPVDFTAFQVDCYGRVGLGTQPEALLHIEPPYMPSPAFDESLTAAPLVLVRGSNTVNPDVDAPWNAFVVDRGVRVGLGTTQPSYLLHLDTGPQVDPSYDPATSLTAPAAPAMLGMTQFSSNHVFPFIELKDDQAQVLTTVDSAGHIFVGSNAQNAATTAETEAFSFATTVHGDALITGKTVLSQLVGRDIGTTLGSRVIDFNGSFASNLSNLDVQAVSIGSLTAADARIASLRVPGVCSNASSSFELDDGTAFLCRSSYAIFGDRAQFSNLTQSEIYATTQGRVKIVGSDTLLDTTPNALLAVDARAPAFMVRNSGSVNSYGSIGFYPTADASVGQGFIKHGGRAFFIVPSGGYGGTVALKATSSELNALGNTLIVRKDNTRSVAYFNASSPDITTDPKLKILNGVQIQGDLWIETAATGSNTATINGALTVTGKTTLSNVTMSGQVVGYSLMQWSDSNLKSDISPIEPAEALDKILRLQGHRFRMRGAAASDAPEIGLIAQEVAQVVPEVVRGANEYMSVAYGNMAGLFVQAFKALNEKVERLSQELAEERSKRT